MDELTGNQHYPAERSNYEVKTSTRIPPAMKLWRQLLLKFPADHDMLESLRRCPKVVE